MTTTGRLTDLGGVPLPAGVKEFTFRIFNSSNGGAQLWPAVDGEVQNINTDADGLWTAQVGSVSPLTEQVFADSDVFLEVDVDGTTLPRTRLTTSPFAFHVSTVDGASGGTISGNVEVSGNIKSGGKFVQVGEENLRMIRGVIASNGTIMEGTGFQATRTTVGVYTITFDTPFSDTPAGTATSYYDAGFEQPAYAAMSTLSASSIRVELWSRYDNSAWVDVPFSFIAIGPR
jgi:hypothetical protein